jgi:hypothetical protein
MDVNGRDERGYSSSMLIADPFRNITFRRASVLLLSNSVVLRCPVQCHPYYVCMALGSCDILLLAVREPMET